MLHESLPAKSLPEMVNEEELKMPVSLTLEASNALETPFKTQLKIYTD